MTPDQFEKLLQTISHSPTGFNWVQGMTALGATLVSVTGVVVGMKSAITMMSKQLEDQTHRLDALSSKIAQMSEQLAVLKYAHKKESGDD